jgi:hypothetical protein
MAFAQSSERRVAPGRSRSQLPTCSTFASRGIRSECAPPPTCPLRVHSRQCCHRLRPDGYQPARIAFRPRGFSPPRRFAPRIGLQACCILVPERVRHVFYVWSLLATTPAPEGTKPAASSVPRAFPRRYSHPSKKSPRQQHVALLRLNQHHCGPCPLVVGARPRRRPKTTAIPRSSTSGVRPFVSD